MQMGAATHPVLRGMSLYEFKLLRGMVERARLKVLPEYSAKISELEVGIRLPMTPEQKRQASKESMRRWRAKKGIVSRFQG
jgi:hypothetical protein